MFYRDIVMKLKSQDKMPDKEAGLLLNVRIDKKRRRKPGDARPILMGGWCARKTMAAITRQLSDAIMDNVRPVRSVTIAEKDGKVEVNTRLAWWAVFGLGLVHRLTRRRVRHVISNLKPVGAEVELKRVGVFV